MSENVKIYMELIYTINIIFYKEKYMRNYIYNEN